jgi:hypothetical protein
VKTKAATLETEDAPTHKGSGHHRARPRRVHGQRTSSEEGPPGEPRAEDRDEWHVVACRS